MIGAGAIGGTIGAALADSGTEAVLVARGANADAVETSGVRLRTPDRTITAHPTVVRKPAEVALGTHDVLILATKTHQALSALQDWADLPVHDDSGNPVGTAGEHLPLVLMLNGVEAARIAPRWFAEVYSTTIWLPALHIEPGEVVVRMPWATQGYLGDAPASAALWAGGYLHTNDIGVIDPDGRLQITDRIKDVIKTGGEWVSSLELEDILSRHPAVRESAVIGVKDARWGERPLALVVLADEHVGHVDPDALRAHVKAVADRGLISRYAVPERLLIVDAIEKTSVGKINKRALRERYQPD